MEWRDEGIVLSARRHGENAVILTVLTMQHGRHAGLIPGGAGKRSRGLYEPGNVLSLNWRARLEDHLGTFKAELMTSHAATILGEKDRLAGLAALTAMAEALLPEREPHPKVYEAALIVLRGLSGDIAALHEGLGWAGLYIRWELGVLSELGYGLDLSSCAATDTTEDLIYVSPKSARAVSAAAGAPYKGKLLALPPFLTSGGQPQTAQEVLDGLDLTAYFLERHVLGPHRHSLPPARLRLVDLFAG